MIREMMLAFWGWRRDKAMAAGKAVLDPECLRMRFLSWLVAGKDKRKRKGKGGRLRGPVRPGGGKWVCLGCGMTGHSDDEEYAYELAVGHAQLHGNEYDVAVEPV